MPCRKLKRAQDVESPQSSVLLRRLLGKFSLLLLEQRRKEGGNESDGHLEEELQKENVQRPCG